MYVGRKGRLTRTVKMAVGICNCEAFQRNRVKRLGEENCITSSAPTETDARKKVCDGGLCTRREREIRFDSTANETLYASAASEREKERSSA